nr:aspartate aminotransferase family protein [Lachnospiraceae bacterium]
MTMEQYVEQGEELFLKTYGRYKVVFDKGDGMYLYDVNGKKYLDFGAGIAVFALGYNNKEYNDSLKAQIDKLLHTSNYFYNVPSIEAAKKLTDASGLKRVFFTNSGAEAVEGALKLAKKYYFNKHNKADGEIIAFKNSFHGRTIGSLSVTGQPKYQEAFQPIMGNVKFATYNDFNSVTELVNDKTCAIILETMQGEGGFIPADKEFIKNIRKLCDEKDIVLILDEIQCGMGRSGAIYAYKLYDVMPDILTTAKALGCGVPVGAFVANEKVGAAFTPGDHGSTYGGNPFVTKAVSTVFDLFEKNNILDNVNESSKYLFEKLGELKEKYSCIKDIRGLGLMVGMELDKPVKDIIAKCIDNGLILFSAGANVIRFLPPLIVSKENSTCFIIYMFCYRIKIIICCKL